MRADRVEDSESSLSQLTASGVTTCSLNVNEKPLPCGDWCVSNLTGQLRECFNFLETGEDRKLCFFAKCVPRRGSVGCPPTTAKHAIISTRAVADHLYSSRTLHNIHACGIQSLKASKGSEKC